MMPKLSLIVITKNEERTIARCLQSVDFADDLIVVDSGSVDRTVEIARANGARVVETADWPGYGPQKRRALDLARGEWVLSLDADEWIDPSFGRLINEAIKRIGRAFGVQDATTLAVLWPHRSIWRMVFRSRRANIPAWTGSILKRPGTRKPYCGGLDKADRSDDRARVDRFVGRCGGQDQPLFRRSGAADARQGPPCTLLCRATAWLGGLYQSLCFARRIPGWSDGLECRAIQSPLLRGKVAASRGILGVEIQ